VLTREPSGSPFAERLRSALLSDRGRALPPDEQAILFAAARADHVDSLIRPALAAGRWVISDRFADSTAAYQGAAGAADSVLVALTAVAVGDARPDLTLLLDLPPAIGLSRASARSAPDAFERDTLAVHEARRAAFLAIAEREPQRVVVLDAAAGEDALADAVWRAVSHRFPAVAEEAAP
jgi:dTMP kinase